MAVKEIIAKSILRKSKKVDSWFIARYAMNLYRGCLHNCSYCDGRADKYQVEGVFGKDVAVKINAIELLEKELDPTRRRKPLRKNFVLLGGGVGDAYQPIEKRYRLAREALKLLDRFDYPVHVLTKSTLLERDLDLLATIDRKSKALISMSFSSMDKSISAQFEPGVAPPAERLSLLSRVKKQGMAAGAFLMPVIPFVSDTPLILEESIAKCAEAGLDYVIFGAMTLKPGNQADYFFSSLRQTHPELVNDYRCLYAKAGHWGNASDEYYHRLNRLFASFASRHSLPKRIPLHLYQATVDDSERVIVMLEQLDYLLKLKGGKSPYGYGAYSLSRLNEPIPEFKGDLKQLKGIGPTTERLVREILQTGTCRYYERLITS